MFHMNLQFSDIGHMIQLAIAPTFLLSGVATMLMVLINRLARIIDRTRVLEDRLDNDYNDAWHDELDVLYQRSHLINYAITLATACGLMVCLVIAMLFLGDSANISLDKYVAAAFVFGMVALIGCFSYLLREIFIASAGMRKHRHRRFPRNIAKK